MICNSFSWSINIFREGAYKYSSNFMPFNIDKAHFSTFSLELVFKLNCLSNKQFLFMFIILTYQYNPPGIAGS